MVKNNPFQGRRKIEMKKISKKNNLQVTFSKRRAGHFKKASELCTLFGVDAAIVVFSPAGKVFSLGHPHIESIVDRFLTRSPRFITLMLIHELNAHLAQLDGMLGVDKRNGEALYVWNVTM